MLGVRLPVVMDKKLTSLSKKTHRPKSFYVREALEKYFEDMEDYYLAVQAYENHMHCAEDARSLEEVAKDLNIALR